MWRGDLYRRGKEGKQLRNKVLVWRVVGREIGVRQLYESRMAVPGPG